MTAAESMAPSPKSVDESATGSLKIEGITESTVIRYFETLNSGKFEATAALFATDGVMNPPFESGIVGPEAIATYLKQEAQGMKLEPNQGIAQKLESDQIQYQVAGKVQTPLFGVNVSWLFLLNPERKILSTTIKLLASPQELLALAP